LRLQGSSGRGRTGYGLGGVSVAGKNYCIPRCFVNKKKSACDGGRNKKKTGVRREGRNGLISGTKKCHVLPVWGGLYERRWTTRADGTPKNPPQTNKNGEISLRYCRRLSSHRSETDKKAGRNQNREFSKTGEVSRYGKKRRREGTRRFGI